MVLLGNRKACIATHNDYSQACPHCKSYTVQYKIYREYIHVFWIPVFSSGPKTCIMSCTSCTYENIYSSKSDYYICITKTPIYLYSWLTIVSSLIVFAVYQNLNTQKEKALFVKSPKINDVYLIRKDVHDTAFYSFMKVHAINNDTLTVYPNVFMYYSFVSQLDASDAFIKQELFFSKNDLQKMLENEELVFVERDYDTGSNFNKPALIPSDSLY